MRHAYYSLYLLVLSAGALRLYRQEYLEDRSRFQYYIEYMVRTETSCHFCPKSRIILRMPLSRLAFHHPFSLSVPFFSNVRALSLALTAGQCKWRSRLLWNNSRSSDAWIVRHSSVERSTDSQNQWNQTGIHKTVRKLVSSFYKPRRYDLFSLYLVATFPKHGWIGSWGTKLVSASENS